MPPFKIESWLGCVALIGALLHCSREDVAFRPSAECGRWALCVASYECGDGRTKGPLLDQLRVALC